MLKKILKKLKTYKLRDYLITALIGLPGTFFYYVFYGNNDIFINKFSFQ